MTEDYIKFRDKLSSDRKKILDGILKNTSEDCIKVQKEEIQRDRNHTDLVNMCAFAFSENGPLSDTGYHFITVEPLYRLRMINGGTIGNKIFDLVIYNNNQKKAILIECKTSISNPRKDVLEPLKQQIKTVIKNKISLEEEIGGEIDAFEYVVCGLPQDIEEVAKSLQSDDTVCLWTADLFTSTLKLYNPSGSTEGNITGKLINLGQLHRDETLRRRIFRKIESNGQIEGLRILPSSHVCRILTHVIVRITRKHIFQSTNSDSQFSFTELAECVQKELRKLEFENAKQLATILFKLGIKFKIMETSTPEITNDSEVIIRLKSGSRSLKTIEKYVEDKYIDSKCKEESSWKSIDKYKQIIRSDPNSIENLIFKASDVSSRALNNNIK